ncbi:zinc-binding dehydrogenase [bacterium]|nr:zinc-binding dehydrogenase [bacterium]
MKVVIAHRDGSPKVVDLPEPALGRNTVRVRVSHSAVSLPEEMDALKSVEGRLKPDEDGLPLGSSCSGLIEDLGSDVRSLKKGLRVAAFGRPYVYHATHLSVPENMLVELPKKVNHEEGAFAAQGARAMHLFRQSGVELGGSLLVFGGGMMGILVAQIARAAGAAVLLIDDQEHRLTKARNVGIAQTAGYDSNELVREVSAMTGSQGADGAIVTADATDKAIDEAAQLLRFNGRLILTGRSPMPFDSDLLVEKEICVRPVTHAGAGHRDPHYERDGIRYPRGLVRWTVRDNVVVFLNLVAERKVQITPLISERLPLERAAAAFEKIQRSRNAVIGAVLAI